MHLGDMKPPEALLKRLRIIAEQQHEHDVEDGDSIYFSVCSCCGRAKWLRSVSDGKARVCVTEDDGKPCEECQNVFRRAPEVSDWVLRVLFFRKEMGL